MKRATTKNEPFLFRGLRMERTNGGSGVMIRHHPESECDQHIPCPFHRPSEHRMADWPMTIWRGLILRICKHQRTHPDPDSAAFAEYTMPGCGAVVHNCDGCCREPVQPVAPAEMAAARAGLEQLASSLEQLDVAPFHGRGTD